MDGRTVIILVLAGLLVFAYFKGSLFHSGVDTAINKTKSIVNLKDWGKPASCPTTDDYVCANSTTYKNYCYAKQAGFDTYTMGACQ